MRRRTRRYSVVRKIEHKTHGRARSARSQASAWECGVGSSSFPKHRKLELSGLGFPSWSLGTRVKQFLISVLVHINRVISF
ncbi:MAG: hypothetical protein EPO18_06845 [Methylobacter sp.]|nr:MAG: hypothetical protein EPO18_06845 [Methylobacter sp.]